MANRRTRIAEGVFADRYGLAACVKLGRVQREKRFPADTPLEILKSWRVQTRADLDAERGDAPTALAGSLEKDAALFLKRKIGRPGYKAERVHLNAWIKAFGRTKSRRTITSADVQRQIAKWHEANVAAETIRKRCRVLRQCCRALDGPRARTPLDYVKLPKPAPGNPVAVPLAMIKTVAKRLRAANRQVDLARFLVRATTGQRPTQIMRATADDLDFKRRIWFVKPAKGGVSIPMPMNDEMIAAWKAFQKANAWGTFDTGTACRILREHGWPKDIRPYALRSTFAIDLLLSGADLGDVQGLLGHSAIQTTRKHYAPILTARLRAVTDRRRLRL